MTVRIGRTLRGGSVSHRHCGNGATLEVYCWLPLPTSANGSPRSVDSGTCFT